MTLLIIPEVDQRRGGHELPSLRSREVVGTRKRPAGMAVPHHMVSYVFGREFSLGRLARTGSRAAAPRAVAAVAPGRHQRVLAANAAGSARRPRIRKPGRRLAREIVGQELSVEEQAIGRGIR